MTAIDARAAQPTEPQPNASARARRSLRQKLRLPLMVGVPLVAALAGAYLVVTGGRYISTDDAYVDAAKVSVSSDVAGRVVAVDVVSNQTVKTGQVLFRLDDRPFRIAVQDAEAQLASARLKVSAAKAAYAEKIAQLKAAQNTLTYQESEYDRQNRLVASGDATRARFDQASHALVQARQDVAATQQQVASALADLGGDPDIAVDRHPLVQQAQAVLDRARLNLSYTAVAAAEDGVVTKVDQLQPGDYVTAGQPVFSLVSANRIWIEANFKETELTHMRPGQTATVEIDSYPDAAFTARVTSLSPGTGSTFALLPPENATGNWVKVVQRLPVRLVLETKPAGIALHSGLSATVSVDTEHRGRMLTLAEGFFGGRAEAKAKP